MENIIVKTMMKGKKNFLTCLLNNSIKKIENTKSSSGILFPERMMPVKKTINNIGIKYLDIFLDLLEKNKGNTKKLNKENLCMKPPAINSSPNGPPSFLPDPTVLNPKISCPNLYW